MITPLTQIYKEKNFIESSAKKIFEYFSTLGHNSYNQQMLLLALPKVAISDPIDEFAFFLEDFDENGEALNENPKIAHFLMPENLKLENYADEDNKVIYLEDFAET